MRTSALLLWGLYGGAAFGAVACASPAREPRGGGADGSANGNDGRQDSGQDGGGGGGGGGGGTGAGGNGGFGGGLPDAAVTDAGPSMPTKKVCQKLDIVFAVDDSGSMEAEQEAMGTSIFPAFARRLLAELPMLKDFRVGVLDACPAPLANFHTRGEGGMCQFESGAVWMDSRSTKLVDEFACVGDIDSTDTNCPSTDANEQPISTIATALEPTWHGPGKPNAGFLRDDAILVAVAIMDEDEQPMPQRSAREVYDRLLAVKGGDANRVVLLSIGGPGPYTCYGPYGTATNAVKLREITSLFAAHGRGVFWNICAGSFEEGLGKALATIKTACMDFCTGVGTAGCD